MNTTGRYEEDFPFVSPCGREMNYIRCDDVPIVYTHLLDSNGQVIQDIESHGYGSKTITPQQAQKSTESNLLTTPSEMLSYGGTGDLLTAPFLPNKLCMLPDSGRVYHAGLDKLGKVGLVKSSLAIELSKFFVYDDGANEFSPPTGFKWRGRTWTLDNDFFPN